MAPRNGAVGLARILTADIASIHAALDRMGRRLKRENRLNELSR